MTQPHHTSRFATLIACAVAAAAVAVPLAQASRSQSLVTEHSASQNRVDLRDAGNYGPLDPAIAAAIRNHQSTQSVPLITEHAAGQNGTGQPSAAGKYGPLDPAIATAIRNHSHGQNGVFRSAGASAQAAAPNGFDWSAAGIGATVAFAAMLLGLAVAKLVPRRSRAQLA